MMSLTVQFAYTLSGRCGRGGGVRVIRWYLFRISSNQVAIVPATSGDPICPIHLSLKKPSVVLKSKSVKPNAFWCPLTGMVVMYSFNVLGSTPW